MDPVSTLREIERRAHARPCSRHDLRSLEAELELCVQEFRRGREVVREKVVIDSEPKQVRQAIHAARIAIKRAVEEHSVAAIEVSRIEHLVRCGHVHQAAIRRTQLHNTAKFTDLKLDFVDTAFAQQAQRGYRLVTVAILSVILVLVIVTIVELAKRSHAL
jgi:UDP-2,3-diacylglucosamine pyrophosphatase LpxH